MITRGCIANVDDSVPFTVRERQQNRAAIQRTRQLRCRAICKECCDYSICSRNSELEAMDTLEVLSEFAPKPFLTLDQIEVLSVAVTLVVYVCMLIIAVGIVNRGSSLGVSLKNFLSGLIMSLLSIAFAGTFCGTTFGAVSIFDRHPVSTIPFDVITDCIRLLCRSCLSSIISRYLLQNMFVSYLIPPHPFRTRK